MLKKTWPLVFILLALLALPLLVAGQAHDGVLINPDFEEGFTVREASEVEVAIGWEYSYLSGDDRQCRQPCHRPEWKPEEQIISQGKYSQRWFTTFSRQFAAIHQQVDVQAGQWYEFSCDVYAISEPDGQQAVFAGANPWGAGVFERTMIWGQQQPWGGYRKWHRVSVTFQAWGNRARVAVGSNNNYATKNNASYVDNCSIRRVEVGPQPTYTPLPTYTPYPTVMPCPTCAPNGGDGCDYNRIRSDVATVVAEREPVRWPR